MTTAPQQTLYIASFAADISKIHREFPNLLSGSVPHSTTVPWGLLGTTGNVNEGKQREEWRRKNEKGIQRKN